MIVLVGHWTLNDWAVAASVPTRQSTERDRMVRAILLDMRSPPTADGVSVLFRGRCRRLLLSASLFSNVHV